MDRKKNIIPTSLNCHGVKKNTLVENLYFTNYDTRIQIQPETPEKTNYYKC
jgi:hypothetical protein